MPRGKRQNPELRPVETNDLDDEGKAKLFEAGIEKLESLIRRRDEATSACRLKRKEMKSEGFTRAEVDHALWLRKLEDGDESARERIEMQLRIARWIGKPLGYSEDLFAEAAA